MKILLLKPHACESVKGTDVPLGLLYLAPGLIKDGHKVEVEDLMLIEPAKAEMRIKNHIKRMKPDLVGITCNSHERFFVFELAKWVKKIDSSIKVMVGGVHVTFTAESILKRFPEIDIIVRNEGEDSIRELCSGRKPASVAGITYRDKNGKIIVNKARPLISNLDDIPFPARDLVPLNKYEIRLPIPDKPRVTSIITSRGCPFRCNFCSATQMAGNKIRMRSADNVVDEMEQIMDNYPFLDGLFIYDDHFTMNKKRAIAIADEIKKRKLDMRLGCYGRVDSISRELVKSLKSAGFDMISFGIESGSSKVLKAMNKGVNLRKIKDAVKITKSEGILARGSIFFGYPGEGISDILKTFRLIYQCFDLHEIVMGYNPIIYPETPLFYKLKREKYLPENFNWEDEFDIPVNKDVPIYTQSNDKLRKKLINSLLMTYKMTYWSKHPLNTFARLKTKIKE